MKKIIISALSAALVILALASCDAKKFTCNCCEQEKNEKPYTYEGATVCKSCYDGLSSGAIR